MKNKIKGGAIMAMAMAMGMGAALSTTAQQSTPTAQTQPNNDKRSEETETPRVQSETPRSYHHYRNRRLSGPDGRFLNQRQRRKRERQTGRKR